MTDPAMWLRLSRSEVDAITTAFSEAMAAVTFDGDYDAAIKKAEALPLLLRNLRTAHLARQRKVQA